MINYTRQPLRLALTLTLIPISVGCSQAPGYSQQEATQYIRRVFAEAPLGLLPSGDTLVTWTTGPILYHTAIRDGSVVTAGMLRNDPMRGRATVKWRANTPESFSASWNGSKGLPVVVHGDVTKDGVKISGSRDTILAVPSTTWAVADYGMEDLVLPAFDHLSPGSKHTLAILRPYGLKWDTVSASVQQQGNFRTVTLVDKTNAKEWLVLKDSTHVLWIGHSDQEAERRPLEGTSLFSEFERARKAVGRLK